MNTLYNSLQKIGLTTILATTALTGTVNCGRTEKVTDLQSPDYWLETYRDFKQQKSAIEQVKNQVSVDQVVLDNYRKDMAGTPRAKWSRHVEEGMQEKEMVLQAHVSQLNQLIGSYNARADDITKKLVDTRLSTTAPYMSEIKELARPVDVYRTK